MNEIENCLIEKYLDFYSNTEPPMLFNRWCCVSGIATIIGRNAWIQHGHSKIFPNQYIMLVGESGSRKSTTIKTFLKPLLVDVGYNKIAGQKTSKEKFLLDLAEGMENVGNTEEHLDVTKPSGKFGGRANPTMRNLFGVKDTTDPSECLIMSDDFNVFLGHSNIEFIELLTDLWDYSGIYASRTKSGKSTIINDPTLNILAGNTQLGISMSFPTEVIGQGFFSRLIAVYSDPSNIRKTFPASPNVEKRKALIEQFLWIKENFRGEVGIDPLAIIALDEIYQNWKDLTDVRFKSYSTRRFTHLLKLCLCCAASFGVRKIDVRTVEYANSILHYTEFFMPKALGEFGKARNSDVSAKIMELLEKSVNNENSPGMSLEAIWKEVHRDLESMQELAKILQGMAGAGKIQSTKVGFLPRKDVATFTFPHCKVTLLREYLEHVKREGLPI